MSLPEFLLPSPVCCGPHPTNHVVLCFFPCLFFFSALRASLGKRRLRLGSRWGENSKTTDGITQDTARVQSSKIERVKVKFGSSAPCGLASRNIVHFLKKSFCIVSVFALIIIPAVAHKGHAANKKGCCKFFKQVAANL